LEEKIGFKASKICFWVSIFCLSMYCCCAVLMQSMAGLEDVRFLRHLCLYSNEIKKIEHLDHLSELELLWLNDNSISVIEVFILTHVVATTLLLLLLLFYVAHSEVIRHAGAI